MFGTTKLQSHSHGVNVIAIATIVVRAVLFFKFQSFHLGGAPPCTPPCTSFFGRSVAQHWRMAQPNPKRTSKET